jgi:hypothetical protein
MDRSISLGHAGVCQLAQADGTFYVAALDVALKESSDQ